MTSRKIQRLPSFDQKAWLANEGLAFFGVMVKVDGGKSNRNPFSDR
jgi:hypothetical protein